MEYKKLVETTDWGSTRTPNHTYYIGPDGRLVGYVNKITGEEKFLNESVRFDKRRRTFKEV